jgi:hypothetical protein
MDNSEKEKVLRSYMALGGYNTTTLSEKMGWKASTGSRKLRSISPWTDKDIKGIINTLNIPKEEAIRIFFD